MKFWRCTMEVGGYTLESFAKKAGDALALMRTEYEERWEGGYMTATFDECLAEGYGELQVYSCQLNTAGIEREASEAVILTEEDLIDLNAKTR